MVQEHFNYEVWNSFVALPYCFLDFIIYSRYYLLGCFFVYPHCTFSQGCVDIFNP